MIISLFFGLFLTAKAEAQMDLGDALLALGEREKGTQHLQEALEAWDLCLPVMETSAPEEKAQLVRSSREKAKAEIGRRTSSPATVDPRPAAPAAATASPPAATCHSRSASVIPTGKAPGPARRA